MIRGFLKGVIWGVVVSGAALGVLSQLSPLPGTVPPAPEPEPQEAVVAPTPLPKAPEAEAQPEILKKGPGPVVAEEPVTTGEEPAPEMVEGEAASGASAELPAEAPVADAPVPDAPEPVPDLSSVPPAGAMQEAPAAPAPISAQEDQAGLPAALEDMPSGLAAPDAPLAPASEVVPPAAEAPPAAPQEEALLAPAPVPEAAPAPASIAPEEPAEAPAPEPAVETDRLPRIGDAVEEPAADELAELVATGTTPLELFAREFDNPEGKPLFSIILIDEGISAEDRANLAALPFPVTFAIDPLAPDAAGASNAYRAGSQEVAMLASGIPAGATAADLEQTFQALDMALPEAVAVLDRPEGALQDQTDLARAAVPIVAEQGRGLLTYDRGLNPADQVARREGVPAAVIFRVLDGEGESVPKMRNYLDRAAFKAAQEGSVVVIGRTRPDTIAAILEWTVEGRAASVALAPVSAVLEAAATP